MTLFLVILISGLALAVPGSRPLAAQAAPVEPETSVCNPCREAVATLNPGTRLSLLLRDDTELRGAFVTLRADTLVLRKARPYGRDVLLLRPITEVRSLRLGKGGSRKATLPLVLLGAVAGGALGAHLGQEAVKDNHSMSINIGTEIVMPIVGALGGTMLGAVIGLVIDRGSPGAPATVIPCE